MTAASGERRQPTEREGGRLDWVVTEHRITSRHLCTCGWEGVSATTHIIDVLRIEQVGYIDSDGEFWEGGASPDLKPVYRLGATDGR